MFETEPTTPVLGADVSDWGPIADGVICDECGNDEGPWAYADRRLCSDCLELQP